MRGQWIGTYTGNTTGNIMVNIDEKEDVFEVVAYTHPDIDGLPGAVASAATLDKSSKQEVTAYTNPIDPRTGRVVEWNEIAHLYPPDTTFVDTTTVNFEYKGTTLAIESRGANGSSLSCVLERPEKSHESKIKGEVVTWQEFKAEVSRMTKSKHLYRGQKAPWRLRTSFHRRERYRISEFTSVDVQRLHQKLSGITSHYFDLDNPKQNGCFFNLLQHHGYPTPLLDWSYSPYVAAFFAFREWGLKKQKEGHVRIYVFNNEDWQTYFQQIQNLDPPTPHLSVIEFIAIDNPRIVPQQAVTTATNIDDIEWYVLQKERELGIEFIRAFDIPVTDREEAMRDLRFMGITAGSMFPSIDGVCEEMREIHFDN